MPPDPAAPVSREAARQAKGALRECLQGVPGIVGLGLTRHGQGYALRVNLSAEPACALPAEVAGVPVLVQVVGAVRALPAGKAGGGRG